MPDYAGQGLDYDSEPDYDDFEGFDDNLEDVNAFLNAQGRMLQSLFFYMHH